MNGRFADDTNAVVDYLRESRPIPPALLSASEILLPLTVLGELFAGAFASDGDPEIVSRWFRPCRTLATVTCANTAVDSGRL